MSPLWLTRTWPESSPVLGDALAAGGWAVSPLPVLQITPQTIDPALRERVHSAQHLVWTSPAAVRHSQTLWAPGAPRVPCHAVGARTAECVRAAWAVPVCQPESGHGLLAWAREQAVHWPPGTLCGVITGADGVEDWQQEPALQHVHWLTVPVYRRDRRACPLPAASPRVILATSALALQALTDLLREANRTAVLGCALLLPHVRLVAVAQRLGWSGTMHSLPDLRPASVLLALEEFR